jgi:hypothetical protein
VLSELFPGASIDVEALYATKERAVTARHKTYEAYQRITLTSVAETKMTLYGDLVKAILADQLEFPADRTPVRVIDERNGRDSLEMSVDATRLAQT